MDNEIPTSLLVIRQRAKERPRFRGVLHTWCFFLSIPIAVVLIWTAPSARTAFAAFTFSFGFLRCWE